ncbi:nSTAND1 domain-containing NTPase [Monashia sp. NPDC004114]
MVRVQSATETVGTGFIVSEPERLVLTCAHVVEYAGGIPGGTLSLVHHASGQLLEATVLPEHWHEDEDVAVLQVSPDSPWPDGADTVPFSMSTSPVGHDAWTFGYPPAKPVEGLVGTAQIAAEIADENGMPVLQLSGADEIVPGFSGAPLVDVVSGRLAGMVDAITSGDHGRQLRTAFAIPASTILRLVPGLAASDVQPYFALDTFTEAQKDLYFGREETVARLVTAVRRPGTRFLAVLGPSGSGKSSLVRAGLVPALASANGGAGASPRVIVTRPADLLAHPSDPGSDDASVMSELNRVVPMSDTSDSPVLLTLDQFEETFVVLPPAQRRAVLQWLASLVTSTRPVTVVLVMRDEFFAALVHEAPGLTRALEEGLRTIPPTLGRPDLSAIVTGPAGAVGLRFEEGLAKRIVDDAIDAAPSAEEDTAASTVLPLLEFALTQLWERRVDGLLTHQAYEQIGKVAGGIAGWAEEALARFDESDLPKVRRVFLDLVHLGDERHSTPDSRRRRDLTELARTPDELTDVTAIVYRLADERLLVTRLDSQTGDVLVELVHDSLLREWQRLREWLDADRSFLIWRQDLDRARERWESSGEIGNRDSGALLRGRTLEAAKRLDPIQLDRLSDAQREFITASDDAWVAEQQRLQRALSEAEQQRARAEEELVRAGLREQALRVRLLLDVEPVAALAVAADTVLTNLAELPDDLIDLPQVSLHAALLTARELTVVGAHHAPVTCIAASPDGRLVVSASVDTTLRAWSPTGQPLGPPWQGHDAAVTAVAVDPLGRFVISGSADRTLRAWSPTGQPLGPPWQGHEGAVTAVAVDPLGRFVISGSADRTLRAWSPTGQPMGAPWHGHDDEITTIGILPERVVSASADGTLRAWAENGDPIGPPWRGHDGVVLSMAVHAPGGLVISGGADRSIRVWSSDGRPVGRPWQGHVGGVSALTVSRDGLVLVSAGGDGVVRTWDLKGRAIRPDLVGHQGAVTSLALVDDDRLVVSAGADATVRTWARDGHGPYAVLSGGGTDVNGVIVLDDARQLVSAGADMLLRRWSTSGEPIGDPWAGHEGYVYSLARDAAGTRIASAAADGTARVWDAPTGRCETVLRGHRGAVYAVDVSADGQLVATGGADATVLLWRPDGAVVAGPLAGHRDEVWSAVFTPDAHLLATGSNDGTIRLWRSDGSSVGKPLEGHGAGVRDLAFFPDGTTLVSAGLDRTVRLWDVTTGEAVAEPMHGHRGPVHCVAVAPDGQSIVSGSADGTLRIWDRVGRAVSEPVHGHDGGVWRVSLARDVGLVASAGADGRVLLWRLGWRTFLEMACLRIDGHPAIGGSYGATMERVRAQVPKRPWVV